MTSTGATPETHPTGTALTFWVSIGANLVGSAYASIQARGLYSDGAAYLVGIYQDRWFLFFDTRTVVQVLRQAPAVLVSRCTSASLFECGQLFSFAMLSLPWVLCGLCWFVLPKRSKAVGDLPASSDTRWMDGHVDSCGWRGRDRYQL